MVVVLPGVMKVLAFSQDCRNSIFLTGRCEGLVGARGTRAQVRAGGGLSRPRLLVAEAPGPHTDEYSLSVVDT